jgi:NAD(P)-dependent dehydrogenase (short-subunit alcohol dehydrogenase family)
VPHQERRSPIVACFGSLSNKVVEPDGLGRPQRILTITPLGPGWTHPLGVIRYDADDVEFVLRDEPRASWQTRASHWREDRARRWLPWAVVHQALPMPFVAHVHADAVCTLANAPSSQSVVRDVFGDQTTWLPYATPGPALAEVIARQATGSCALVEHLGLFAWGDSLTAIEELATSIEGKAEAWLEGLTGDPRDQPPDKQFRDLEGCLVAIRGQMSRPSRLVVVLDTAMRSIASRNDLDAVVREGRRAEQTWPFDVTAAIARDAPNPEVAPTGDIEVAPFSIAPTAGAGVTPGIAAPARIALVPGLGQIAAGDDLVGANYLGAVAGHVHRVSAALIDLFGTGEDLPSVELDVPGVALDAAPELDAAGFVGRVYIVTGAASGIGRDIARHLAAKGASLGLGDIDAEALERTADELEGPSGRPVTVAGDLTDEAIAVELVGATVRRFGGVDGAVLNAGVAIPGELTGLSAADWRRSLDVNATSHFLLAKQLLPVLRSQGLGGSLVFIGSKNMFSPGAGFGAYSASKAALAQLARTVAIEAGPFGVRSNIVNPDNVFDGSALWSPALRAQRAAVYKIRPEELEAYYTQRNLMKVPITGRDVAKAVAFMLSDDAMRTTACVLTVDGGVPGVFPR